ncbi:OmpA family protein [Fodinicurvata halophila]|uniref:OmpA family protein n=1 Tax=Fodinicurvata halophila TaxID=1419723 RepID=A0ABV8UIF4_9PROT
MIRTIPELISIPVGCLFAIGLVGAAAAQEPQDYPMAQGGTITLPSGEISFADRVVRFEEGDPPSEREDARDPEAVLGPPDREEGGESAALTLGCHGSIVLEFTDNALIDAEGADLHVWEVGDDAEPTEVAISGDGDSWHEVGTVSGGTSSLDIDEVADEGASYRYVRLSDRDCLGRHGRWPGADIDAVAAVGTAERIVLDSGVLFGFDEAVLSEEAAQVLDDLAERIAEAPVSRLEIEGHTDSRGSASYNLELSERRAESVREYLASLPVLEDLSLDIRAVGEAEPVASNETEEGRQENRRVEILALP